MTNTFFKKWKNIFDFFQNKRFFTILKFQKSANFQFSTFFSFFLLQNGHNIIFFRLEKTELTYLISLYLISQKPQKMHFCGKTANCAKTEPQKFFNPKILDQRPKTNRKRYSNILEPWVPQILLYCAIDLNELCDATEVWGET